METIIINIANDLQFSLFGLPEVKSSIKICDEENDVKIWFCRDQNYVGDLTFNVPMIAFKISGVN